MTDGPSHDDLQDFLTDLDAELRAEADWGTPAGYIPELADVAPDQFAISVALAGGRVISAGAHDTRFSIQSVSKVFTLACVLGRIGDQLWRRVGREPSGTSFDSIVLLEREQGRPRNPFINAGAIVTTDALLDGRMPNLALSEIIGFLRAASEDADIHIDAAVAASEERTGYRNVALANYLASHKNLFNPPELTLGTYYHQCAIAMTTDQLARAGRVFAGLPDAPRMISTERARRINALMMTRSAPARRSGWRASPAGRSSAAEKERESAHAIPPQRYPRAGPDQRAVGSVLLRATGLSGGRGDQGRGAGPGRSGAPAWGRPGVECGPHGRVIPGAERGQAVADAEPQARAWQGDPEAPCGRGRCAGGKLPPRRDGPVGRGL